MERRQCAKFCRRLEGSLRQDGNKVVLHQKLALKKRVYEAGDWNGFRNAVNAHKSFGDYIVIKR